MRGREGGREGSGGKINQNESTDRGIDRQTDRRGRVELERSQEVRKRDKRKKDLSKYFQMHIRITLGICRKIQMPRLVPNPIVSKAGAGAGARGLQPQNLTGKVKTKALQE